MNGRRNELFYKNLYWKRLLTQEKVSAVIICLCPVRCTAYICDVGRYLYHILLSLTLSNIIPRSLDRYKSLFCG